MRTLILKQWVAGALFLSFPLALSAQDKEIQALAGTVAESLRKAPVKTVAVVDFTDLQGNVTELGRYLAEEISVALAGSGTGIRVVDRTHLKALLQENKLAGSGIIDPATALRLGKIAGVEVLITGTITPFGDTVRFSVKALDTATAQIVTAATTEIPKTRTIEAILNQGVAAAVPAGPASPAYPSGGSAAPAAEVRGFRFALQSCRLAGSSMICRLAVSNLAGDRNLKVYSSNSRNSTPPSRFIDGSGIQYDADHVQLGGSVGDWVAENTMVTGVATALQVRFDEVSSEATSIALLELSCEAESGAEMGQFGNRFQAAVTPGKKKGSSNHFVVQFRNIPVTR